MDDNGDGWNDCIGVVVGALINIAYVFVFSRYLLRLLLDVVEFLLSRSVILGEIYQIILENF